MATENPSAHNRWSTCLSASPSPLGSASPSKAVGTWSNGGRERLRDVTRVGVWLPCCAWQQSWCWQPSWEAACHEPCGRYGKIAAGGHSTCLQVRGKAQGAPVLIECLYRVLHHNNFESDPLNPRQTCGLAAGLRREGSNVIDETFKRSSSVCDR